LHNDVIMVKLRHKKAIFWDSKKIGLECRDVNYGTFGGSGIFRNLYFKSRIVNPIPE